MVGGTIRRKLIHRENFRASVLHLSEIQAVLQSIAEKKSVLTTPSLLSMAPLARDSGKHQGKRMVRGGRRDVRAILFVVAGVVRRYDADFAAFHQRLTAAGKPKKVIRIALAHKLLVRLNAKARQVRNEFAALTA